MVVIPLDPDELTDAERVKSLEAVSLVKEKINGVMKVITCKNGSKKKGYLKEGGSLASPTVSLEGLFTTLVID